MARWLVPGGARSLVASCTNQCGDCISRCCSRWKACGSSGTTAGLALGNKLAGLGADVHAYTACDDPEYFYAEIDILLQQLGYTDASARDLFTAHQAKGDGYALSRQDELQTVRDFALASGVVLDPVYSGKALHSLLQNMDSNPEQWRGKKVLFVHTGGLLGMYDKLDQLQPLVEGLGRSHRMDVSSAVKAAAAAASKSR